jgi:hypothetical protein
MNFDIASMSRLDVGWNLAETLVPFSTASNTNAILFILLRDLIMIVLGLFDE